MDVKLNNDIQLSCNWKDYIFNHLSNTKPIVGSRLGKQNNIIKNILY